MGYQVLSQIVVPNLITQTNDISHSVHDTELLGF